MAHPQPSAGVFETNESEKKRLALTGLEESVIKFINVRFIPEPDYEIVILVHGRKKMGMKKRVCEELR